MFTFRNKNNVAYVWVTDKNCFRLEWYRDPWACALEAELSGGNDGAEVKLHVGLPLVGSLRFSVERWPWLIRLLGLQKAEGKDYQDCQKQIGFAVQRNGLFLYLWRNYDDWRHPHAVRILHPIEWLLGPQRRTETEPTMAYRVAKLPEGSYEVLVSRWDVTWRRKRFPWLKRVVQRAQVEVLHDTCIPIPGKGDNGHDLADDGIFTHLMEAGDVDEALTRFVDGILATRAERAGAGWLPKEA